MLIRRRIAIITNDVLTTRMAGPAIRAWHMAEVLSAEHEVRLVSTGSHRELSSSAFTIEVGTGDYLRKVEAWCDVLIFQGSVMYENPFLRQSEKVLVIDIYNPMHLETLELSKDRGEIRRRSDVRYATLMISEQLARGDFFLAASPRQRHFWLGHLAAVGRLNTVNYDADPSMESLITVAPFGLSERLPQHRRPALKGVVPGIGPDDKVVLWGGGIYNWFDPATLIRAVDRLRHRRPDVRLYFLGLRHPNPTVSTMRAATDALALSDRLGLTDRFVFFNHDWVPYDDRENYLTEADVGVSTHIEHVETAFSFRTRILDYLWAGLPIISTEGDFFADLIEREELGATVPPGDVEALEGALFRLLDDAEVAAACGSRSADTAKRFTWPEVLQPLVEFCRDPRRAPDQLDAELVALANQIEGPKRPPSGMIDDVRIFLDHVEAGGPRLVAVKALSRFRYAIRARIASTGRGAPNR